MLFPLSLPPSLPPSPPRLLTSHKTQPPLLVSILLAPLFHNHRPTNGDDAGEGGREEGRGRYVLLCFFPSSFGVIRLLFSSSSWCLAREEWRLCRSWVRRVTLPWRRRRAAFSFSFSLFLTCWWAKEGGREGGREGRC